MSVKETFIRDLSGGGNQSGLRDQNARLVLSYIRRHGAMAGAEIARRTGLSAQTVSNIIRALLADGLLLPGETVKGRVGKPSVPMMLNPAGVHALGLNIGRGSLELVLVDFAGQQVEAHAIRHDYPALDKVFGFIEIEIPRMLERNGLSADQIAGLGVARPNRIWDWLEFVKAPDGAMQAWKGIDLAAEIATRTGLHIIEENDATAACVAENLLGRGPEYHDFAYIFLGAFVGGGLVLDGKVVSGRTLNAAALGPIPVPDGAGGTVQLLDVASIHVLDRRLGTSKETGVIWDVRDPVQQSWLEETARNLAMACAAITSVVEVEAILVDGAFPQEIRAALTKQIETSFLSLDITGIERPLIEQAATGQRARSIGAAILPINAKYFVA